MLLVFIFFLIGLNIFFLILLSMCRKKINLFRKDLYIERGNNNEYIKMLSRNNEIMKNNLNTLLEENKIMKFILSVYTKGNIN